MLRFDLVSKLPAQSIRRNDNRGVLASVLVITATLFAALVIVTPTARAQADPSLVGQWSAVQPFPWLATHTSLLPNGKVLFWPTYGEGDNPQIWDPATTNITAVAHAGFNIFCSGHTFLSDGQLLVAGGHITSNVGLPYATIYDWNSGTWTRIPNMNAARWYPTNTSLANGSALVLSGQIDQTQGNDTLPQIWQPSAGSWIDLTSAQLSLPLYPRAFLAPNGKVFIAGPDATSRYLDTTGTGAWSTVAFSLFGYRSYGTAVMYDNGKVLIAGGGDPPTAKAETIDLNQASPAWTNTSPMNYLRRQLNSTLLPDGTVLVTGGSGGSGFDNTSTPVNAAELWDPSTGNWTVLASNQIYRGYHSTAILLPDGRVLSAGGNQSAFKNGEVFSPPYLFKGARPTISNAPTTFGYGSSFFVGTPDGASITKVTLIRTGSVTHAFDMNQRISKLTFGATSGGLNVNAPSDPNLAPPGYYMLFILNSNGVPSVASIVRLQSSNTLPNAPTGLSATPVAGNEIDLTWTDSSNNEDGFSIERSTDGTNFAQIAIKLSNTTSFEDVGLTNSTMYWYRVRAYNGAGNSGYSNVASATTLAVSSPPVVASTSPNFGPAAGGTTVAITGTGFDPGATVSFGGTQATGATINGPTSISAITPPHTTGLVDVTVTNPGNLSGTLAGNRLSNPGFESGLSSWTFVGTGTASLVANDSLNAHSGSSYVQLSSGAGQHPQIFAADSSSKVLNFPVKTGDVITFGGWAYRVSGDGKVRWTLVTLDSNRNVISRPSADAGNLSPGVWKYQESKLTIPAGTAFVQLYCQIYANTAAAVARCDDALLGGGFNYLPNPAPTVTGVSPNTGSANGGTAVTITGTGFLPGVTVKIGGVLATSVTLNPDTGTISAITPAHAAGTVSVTVTNTDNQSGTLANGFTFVNPTSAPTVSSVTPNSGSFVGGSSVTITGTGFVAGAQVTFGGALATNVSVTNGTTIQATTPAHASGSADVTVTNPDGGTGTLTGAYTYTDTNPPPSVASVSPNNGLKAGGTTVTIKGANFVSGATVSFGQNSASNVSFVDANTIAAVTPPNGLPAVVSVTVTNPDGQSSVLSSSRPLNPGFEAGNANWFLTGNGTGSSVSNAANAHSGTNYGQIDTPGGGSTPKYWVSDSNNKPIYFPINPGDLITWGGWVYRASGDGKIRYELTTLDANKGNATRVASSFAAVTATWSYQQNTYTVPAGVAFIQMDAEIYSATTVSSARLDDAVLSGGFTYTGP